MCQTCMHCLEMAMIDTLSCNSPKSQYFRQDVSADNICGFYQPKGRKVTAQDSAGETAAHGQGEDLHEEESRQPCAMENGRKCRGLSVKNCSGCKFYKTKQQLTAQNKKCRRRLNRLPRSKRLAIRESYSIFI